MDNRITKVEAEKRAVARLARRNRAGLTVSRVLIYAVLIFLALLCLLPFYILIINATRAHGDIQSSFSLLPSKFVDVNFRAALKNQNTPLYMALINSLIVSAAGAMLSTYFSAMTAYAIHAYNFKLKNLMFSFILFIMMVPTQVSTLGFLDLVEDMELMDTLWPLIIPAIAAPACFWYMKQYMESVLPLEIVEAARVDGSGEFGTFNRIILPIIKPAIAVQAIFSFCGNWNNYFVPNLVLTGQNKRTMPIVIALLRSADYSKFNMGSVYVTICIAIIPVLIVYIFLSKFIIRGLTLGSVKG